MATYKNIFSAEELDKLLKQLGVQLDEYGNLWSYYISDAIRTLAEKKNDELPILSVPQPECTKENVIVKIRQSLKARGARPDVSKHDDYSSIFFFLDDYLLWYDVYDKYLETFTGKGIKVWFYNHDINDIVHTFADEDGAILKLLLLNEKAQESLRHFEKEQSLMYDKKNLQLALSEESKYESIKLDYEKLKEELLPLQSFLSILPWEEALREHGIDSAVQMLDDIDRFVNGKSPEAVAKYQKRYDNAQNVLMGAKRLGMIRPEETERIKPWEEYINPKVSEYSKEAIDNEYLASVEKVYKDALMICDERGTDYMAKKKKKILADMDVCQQMKSQYGLDCFIDRSQFSRYVSHLNVIINGNQTLIYRISPDTPDVKYLSKMVVLTKTMENLSKQIGKVIRLSNVDRMKKNTLQIVADKKNNEYALELAEKLKMVKGGTLTVNYTYATLSLPLGNMVWNIAFKRKEAYEKFDSITPLLSEYMKAYKALGDIDVKGIFENRLPNI